MENTKSKVVIISGPSGVGKSTICKEIVNRMKDVTLSVSVTTRPKSASEIDGEDYWFISEEEFRERISQGLLLEHAEVFGH
jgi:guanylate kinase